MEAAQPQEEGWHLLIINISNTAVEIVGLFYFDSVWFSSIF